MAANMTKAFKIAIGIFFIVKIVHCYIPESGIFRLHHTGLSSSFSAKLKFTNNIRNFKIRFCLCFVRFVKASESKISSKKTLFFAAFIFIVQNLVRGKNQVSGIYLFGYSLWTFFSFSSPHNLLPRNRHQISHCLLLVLFSANWICARFWSTVSMSFTWLFTQNFNHKLQVNRWNLTSMTIMISNATLYLVCWRVRKHESVETSSWINFFCKFITALRDERWTWSKFYSQFILHHSFFMTI